MTDKDFEDKKNEKVGPDFEELTEAEMEETQGSGDVSAETTPVTSSFPCGAGISAGITIVCSIKNCR